MAMPKFEDLFPKGDGLTYEQYFKLYLNSSAPLKPITPPRLSDHIPKWMWQYISGEYQDAILNCHRIDVADNSANFTTDNSANFTTEIDFHCPEGLTVRLTLTYDMLSHSMFSEEIETFIRAVQPPPLPVISSPHPVIGWRQWYMRETVTYGTIPLPPTPGGMYGLWGQQWETPLMVASCKKGHPAPAENCRCGIYFHPWPAWKHDDAYGGRYVAGIVVATNVIEHEHGYRAGTVRCVAITGVHPEAYGWDGIPIMSGIELGREFNAWRDNPNLIPYPDDSPLPHER